MSETPHILYCHCANAQVLLPATRESALRALCESGLPFETVADLCELSARRDPLLKCVATSGDVVIAACHPRTVRCLFAAADAALPESTQYLDLRRDDAETICAAVREIPRAEPVTEPRDFETVQAELEAAATPADGWSAWAPVIDYDRCTGCMQCLSFCLFGVYGVDGESRIEVRNPEQCKTNCPACSRVCPEAAILFPKHHSDAINGGSTGASDVTHEAMKVDISALLGGSDLASLLRERNQRTQPRFSKERDPEQALAERRKYLAALAQAGDIPPEVFHNLPSPEEIARRSAEAKAKAQAALQNKK